MTCSNLTDGMGNCKVLHIASSYCIDVDLLLAQLVKRGITVSGRNTRNPIDEYFRVLKVALALMSIPPSPICHWHSQQSEVVALAIWSMKMAT